MVLLIFLLSFERFLRRGQFNHDVPGKKNAASERYPERPSDEVQAKAKDGSPYGLKGIDDGRLNGVHVSLEKIQGEKAEERTSNPK